MHYVDLSDIPASLLHALNGSSALQRFKHNNAVETRNKIMLDFYPGLAQTFLPIHAGLDVKFHLSICVAVPGRNRTLFRCILRTHYRLRSAVTQYFCYGRGSYALCKLMNT